MARLQTYAERWLQHDFYASDVAEQHFRTEPMTSSRLAHAINQRIQRVRPVNQPVEVFDIGAGDGSLLSALAGIADFRLHGVDLRPRPDHLPTAINWVSTAADPDPDALTVVICHEFLDDVPCEVVEIDADGDAHLVVVDEAGASHLGPTLGDRAAGPNRVAMHEWLRRWWPTTRPFSRAEIGLHRDRTWRDLTALARGGLAIAIDYGHLLPERMVGTWDAGTLTGFRAGRPVGVRWTTDRNITAHVAMDAIAHASLPGIRHLTRQRRHWGEIARVGYSTGTPGDYLWLEVDMRDHGNG